MQHSSLKAMLLATTLIALTVTSASAAETAPAPAAPQQTSYTVYFEFDQSYLTTDGKAVVASAANTAKQGTETTLDVTGHADRAGDEDYNMGLSARRAQTVKTELLRLGIPDAAIQIAWKGESEPAVPTEDGVAEPQNRRASIIVINPALMGQAATSATATSTGEGEQEESTIADQFSATFGFYTNYVFRGVTQTQNDPAFQGSFDWSHPIGAYAGVWASNIDFTDAPDDDANIEVDFYAGFNNSINKVSYGIGFIYYMYPDANEPDLDGDGSPNDYNYLEVKGSLGYDFGVAAVTASVYWSPDFFGEIGDAIYYSGAVSVPLSFVEIEFLDDVPTLDAWVGYQTFLSDWPPFLPVSASLYEDYVDWSVGLTIPLWGFNIGFRYTDTDIDATDQVTPPFGLVLDSNFADEAFIFSISRSI